MILSGLFEGEAAVVARHAFTPVLGSLQQLAWLAEAVPPSAVTPPSPPFPLHLEIDTGMARQGIQWNDATSLAAFAAQLIQHPQLLLEAVMTHFASPEDPGSTQTAEQLERLRAALATLREHGIAPPLIHAGNSASLFEAAQIATLRDIAQQSGSRLLLRPGIALYGYGPTPPSAACNPC